ncbi:MAG: putative porin, partial [Bacteroidota bacterium]|nr:putative porin [Bacteroidota bacterium]
TGQFFLQDEQFQGNYPLIDFFVNMRIKQARVFFKIDHLNETPFNREFFILPGYPAGERAFRVGISWIFYN